MASLEGTNPVAHRPLTRTVTDAVSMLNVIGRYDYRDPYATRGQPDDWGEEIGRGLQGLRIAYSPDLGYARVDRDVAERVRAAAHKLEALGAIVEEVDPGFESPIDIFNKLWFTASLAVYDEMGERNRQLLDPGMVADARRAEQWSALELFRALRGRALLTQQLEYFNQQYHLVMTPTVAISPFELLHNVPPGRDMRDWEEWAPFSYPFNLSQQPAASVPVASPTLACPSVSSWRGGSTTTLACCVSPMPSWRPTRLAIPPCLIRIRVARPGVCRI
nr:amidase family protein [Halomonas sp. BC04]